MRFRNREDAAEQLAVRLDSYRDVVRLLAERPRTHSSGPYPPLVDKESHASILRDASLAPLVGPDA